MRYLLLIMEERDRRRQRTPECAATEMAQMNSFGAELARRGINKASESLKSIVDGVRINVRDGARVVFDGPFAETKEAVGGFFLLECDSKEEAIAIAADCPAAEWATVELRELGPCDSL
ncbi:MAG: YciI family protein [Casimicrobiaceae bacterium]